MSSCAAISVIVPVYNVADFVEQCAESILEQSFSDFELLLVDDGSTDGSGDLCEEIASKDRRVRCFHKPNGGLSDARNYGVDRLRGDFVTFIDSDDWVEPTYLEYLIKGFENTQVDISTCVFSCRRGESSRPWRNIPFEPEVMTGNDALLSMLYDERVNVSAHGKLYRSSLFESVRYPMGMCYEDVGTTYKLLAEARAVSVGGAPLYNYRMRSGSITQSGSVGIFDRYELAKQAYVDLSSFDEDVELAAERYFTFHALSVLRSCKLRVPSQRIRASELRKEVLAHKKSVITNGRTPARDRIALCVLGFGLLPYKIAWGCYRAGTGRV